MTMQSLWTVRTHIFQRTALKVKVRTQVRGRKKLKSHMPNQRRNQTSRDDTPLQLCDKLWILPLYQYPQIPSGRKGILGIIIFPQKLFDSNFQVVPSVVHKQRSTRNPTNHHLVSIRVGRRPRNQDKAHTRRRKPVTWNLQCIMEAWWETVKMTMSSHLLSQRNLIH